MYYPLIILDNGYVKNVKDAVSEGYCIPGGHFFKINTPLEFTLTILLIYTSTKRIIKRYGSLA